VDADQADVGGQWRRVRRLQQGRQELKGGDRSNDPSADLRS
jgi:hypothetical protein